MTTWEEAAAAAAYTILTTPINRESNNGLMVEGYLDAMRGTGAYNETGFQAVGAHALDEYVKVEGGDPSTLMKSILAVVVSKQHDYGPENILWGREQGIALRMHDKIARINNLVKRGEQGSNEPLSDSWLDLVGYAIVAVMLANGTFELPLFSDLQKAEEETMSSYTKPGVPSPRSGHVNSVPGPDGFSGEDLWAQLESDPDIAAALAEFTDPLPVTAPGPDAVRRYAIRTGGTVEVHPNFAEATTAIIISDGADGRVVIEAGRNGDCSINTNGKVTVDGDHMAIILAMLLGAAETALRWRNTSFYAEVPK